MLDLRCQQALTRSANLSVPWILGADYAYRHLQTPILSDACFDWVCKGALSFWPHIRHPHKYLITPDDLMAGSLYTLPLDAFPTIVRDATAKLLRDANL